MVDKRVHEALEFAMLAHRGQDDRNGKEPFIFHPIHVMENLSDTALVEEKMAALLHDVVEDTDVNIDRIRRLFGHRVADIVELLTKDEKISYDDYIKNIINSKNLEAIKVKIADAKHNRDRCIKEGDWNREKKYRNTLLRLSRAKDALLEHGE